MASARPAWLWDFERGRIIWANTAGVTHFGGETLFDLIDQPFDPEGEPLQRVRAVARSLKPGDAVEEPLAFPFAGREEPLYCALTLHILADGRAGVLAAAADDPGESAAARRLLAEAVGELPLGLLLVEANGRLLFANSAARDLVGDERLATFATWLGGEEVARQLIARTLQARVLATVCPIQTRFGEREARLTARLVGKGSRAGSAISIMVEDVTERRALERALGGRSQAASHAAATARAPREVDGGLSDRDRRTFEELAAALQKAGTDPRAEGGDASKSVPPAQASRVDAKPAAAEPVPELIVAPLDALPQAILLFRGDTVLFANRSAVGLLGHEDRASLTRRLDLAPALASAGDGGEVALTLADGRVGRFSLSKDRFPWNTGPVEQATIRPVDTPASEGQRPAEVGYVARAVESSAAEVPETSNSDAVSEPSAEEIDPVAGRAWEPADPEFRAILDTATDGIIILDPESRIRSFSAGAEALFGYRLAEVYGKPLGDLLTKESRKVLRNYLSALGDSGLASVFNDGREVEAVVSRGGTVPLFLAIGRLGESTRGADERGFCVVLRDLTQWKRTEAELREAKETAERASAQKSEFLANISHELRTPLNAILGFSEVMRSERFGEITNTKYLSYANDIHESGAHLLSLINDLLDLSKVEAGKFELNFTGVNLASLADSCLAILQEQATAGRVVLRRNIPAGLPNVVADLRSMKQIVLNLLANAIRFTDPGGQVIVSARLDRAGELTLSVKDTGIGMSAEELRAALTPFRRVETTGRDSGRGTGLGLPLSKALAEANRARFSVTSEPRKGTLVEIVFPTTRVLAD